MPVNIDSNSKLEFEQRILNPSKYPEIKNDDGTISTHEMAWAGTDDGYYAYPTIVNIGGKLTRLPDDLAWQYALENNEFRKFSTPEDAAEYADGGYKKFFGKGENK